jgi:hypothetical protein
VEVPPVVLAVLAEVQVLYWQ